MVPIYQTDLSGIGPDSLTGFFEGWPDPPSPERLLAVLRGSSHVVLAREDSSGQVVGFVNALSDGVLTAYIPLLEVHASHRGKGIGSELVRQLLLQVGHLYMVDVMCDDDVFPFYERLGFRRSGGGIIRNYAAQAAR